VIRQIVVYSGNTVFELITSDDIIVKMEKALVETIDAFVIEAPLCIMDPFALWRKNPH
jgi:hypothetical protein